MGKLLIYFPLLLGTCKWVFCLACSENLLYFVCNYFSENSNQMPSEFETPHMFIAGPKIG